MVVSGTGPNQNTDDPGAYFVIDRRQRITEWSERAAELTATPASQALGLPCYEVVNGRNPCRGSMCQPDCPAVRELEQGHLTAACSFVVGADPASPRRMRCELHPLPHSPGGAVGRLAEAPAASDGAVSPVQPPLESNADILHALTAFASLSTSLASNDLERSLERALDLLRLATGADTAEIFLTERSTHDMLLTAVRGPFRRAFCQHPRFVPGEGFPGLVWEGGAPVVSEDLEHDRRFLREAIKHEGFQVYLCVPLQAGDTVIGVLCIGSRAKDFATGDALRLLTWSSVPIAIAVQAGLLQASRLEFDRVAGRPAGEHDLDSLLLAVLRQARALAAADAGSITLFDREHGTPVRHLSDGVEISTLAPCVKSGQSKVPCPALHDGHGIALWGSRRQWPLPCRQATRLGRSTACIPIRHRDEPVGLIQLVYRDAEPQPPTRHLSLLLEFASHAGTMLSLVQSGIDQGQRAGPPMVATVQPVAAVGPSAPRRAFSEPYLRIRCLGSFEIERNGKLLVPQAFKRRKAVTLLKILVLHGGAPVAKESLIEWLWPESEAESGLNRLHGIVHALREVIEPIASGNDWQVIHYDGEHYRFDPLEPCWIDLVEFDTARKAGQQAEKADQIPEALSAYDEALRLYRGDLYEEERFAEWVLLDREYWKETYLGLLQRVAGYHNRNGDRDHAIGRFQQIVREDPLRETVQRQLIEALWRAGRRDEALLQYERFAQQLRCELDIAPLPETESLIQRIRQDPVS